MVTAAPPSPLAEPSQQGTRMALALLASAAVHGMLLSTHTRLVAAFDHRHVFLDPDPDPEASYAERRRLFELPGSSWDVAP